MNDLILPFQNQLLEEVKLGLEQTKRGSNSVGILLLGESGTGKTHAADLLVDLLRPYQTGGQLMTPCLRLDANAIGGKDSVPSAGLSQLGRPVRKSQPMVEAMFKDALRQQDVLLVLLEEFHNRLLSGKSEFRSTQGEFLKNLWNFTPSDSVHDWAQPNPSSTPRKLVIVVSGTPNLLGAFETNPELRTRFNVVINSNRLRLDPPEEFKLFRQMLLTFSERFGLKKLVNPDDSGFAVRCYFASAAHLRTLESLFQRVESILSHKSQKSDITSLFAIAFEKVVSNGIERANPFTLSDAEIGSLATKELKRLQSGKGRRDA